MKVKIWKIFIFNNNSVPPASKIDRSHKRNSELRPHIECVNLVPFLQWSYKYFMQHKNIAVYAAAIN